MTLMIVLVTSYRVGFRLQSTQQVWTLDNGSLSAIVIHICERVACMFLVAASWYILRMLCDK